MLNERRFPRCSFFAQHDIFWNSYQTLQALALTIFCPALQLNACSNSGIFDSTLSMRNTGSECGSEVTISRAICGRTFAHHEYAFDKKKRWRYVQPSSPLSSSV